MKKDSIKNEIVFIPKFIFIEKIIKNVYKEKKYNLT